MYGTLVNLVSECVFVGADQKSFVYECSLYRKMKLPVNNALIGKSSFHRVQAINSEIPELFVP
jgi:hypothetical protein